MSIYSDMAGVALNGIASAIDNTGSKQTWNEQYDLWSQNLARNRTAQNAINVNELRLTEVGKEKNLTNTRIRMAQDDAEAARKLSAAVAGVSGGSVKQSIHQTKVNESLAVGQNEQDSRAAKQAYIDQAKQLRYNMETIPTVRKKIYKNTALDTLAKMTPIIGSKEFMNRVTNSFDAWNEGNMSTDSKDSTLDGNDLGGRHGDLDGSGGG